SLTNTFETADSPTAVNNKAPAYPNSPSRSPVLEPVGGGKGTIDSNPISKEKSSDKIDQFLKHEVIPRGGSPGAVHKSARNQRPPNELDNKAKVIPSFDGNPHPVYHLILEGKSYEQSSDKKKIVIPPASAY
ncbi:hypothetical protein SAMD00019534_065320, partial [Acytostelium subglobosum LB1]|uniref:hypothetical protein n=1 Tax=Acytostelium subglobosum LB1 TaxID=1410327 RepID=UPI0006448A6F